MKKKLVILLGLGLVASMAQAELIFVQKNVQRAQSLDWTFGFDGTGAQTTSSDMLIKSGSLTGGSAGDSVTIGVIGATNWNTSAAQAAITGGTFSSYVSGLGTPADLTAIQDSKLGVEGAGGDFRAFDFDGEAIIMTFSGIDSLAETSSFSFTSIGWANAGASELADIFFYDSSANSVSTLIDQGTGSAVTGIDANFTGGIADGDQIIVAYNSGNWKVGSLTVDVIPEPATLGLIAACGGSLLFIRRRFMI